MQRIFYTKSTTRSKYFIHIALHLYLADDVSNLKGSTLLGLIPMYLGRSVRPQTDHGYNDHTRRNVLDEDTTMQAWQQKATKTQSIYCTNTRWNFVQK